jgi:hypothetical protein
MPKNAELKLPSCELEVADFGKNCDCGIAELRLQSNMSLKSCGIAIAEELPSSCGIVIADSKKSCACPPLGKNNVLEVERWLDPAFYWKQLLMRNILYILLRMRSSFHQW